MHNYIINLVERQKRQMPPNIILFALHRSVGAVKLVDELLAVDCQQAVAVV